MEPINTISTNEIKFSCPHCQQHISAGIEAAGMGTQCPACREAIVVPNSVNGNDSSTQKGKIRMSVKSMGISCAIIAAVLSLIYFFIINNENTEQTSDKINQLSDSNQSHVSKKDEDPENPIDPYAQLTLGVAYYQGTDRLQNYKKAVTQFEKSANQGVLFSQYLLGVCYLDGHGVEADDKKAHKWIQRSAEAGYDLAQEHLGRLYVAGLDGERNFIEAYKWLNIAAANCKGDTKKSAIKWRQQVTNLLSHDDLQKAQKLSSEWKKKPAYKK